MSRLTVVLFTLLIALVALVTGSVESLCAIALLGMAKVNGPLFSLDASGTVAKAVTFAKWRGIAYVRKWFLPKMGMNTAQVNMRIALPMAMVQWQEVLSEPQKAGYVAGAQGTKKSGINLYMKRALDAYVLDPTPAVVPLTCVTTGTYPDDVTVWTHA
jgi:hypothetical protein